MSSLEMNLLIIIIALAICIQPRRAIVPRLRDPQTHPHWNLLDHDICGESITNRIIGGVVADMGQFPWLAKLGYITPSKGVYTAVGMYDFKCGGTLINKLYVLTAAHCITNLGSGVLSVVRLGEYDVQQETDCDEQGCAPPVQDFMPHKIICSEHYNASDLSNDIALIRLSQPVEYHSFVSPICLPYGKLLYNHGIPRILEVAGWGVKNMKTMQSSKVPLYVKIPRVDSKVCLNKLSLRTVTPGQLCVGGQIGYDSCTGDSGGPLMTVTALNGPPKYFIVGVVSFGSSECGTDSPAIYSKVTYYLEWILENINP